MEKTRGVEDVPGRGAVLGRATGLAHVPARGPDPVLAVVDPEAEGRVPIVENMGIGRMNVPILLMRRPEGGVEAGAASAPENRPEADDGQGAAQAEAAAVGRGGEVLILPLGTPPP